MPYTGQGTGPVAQLGQNNLRLQMDPESHTYNFHERPSTENISASGRLPVVLKIQFKTSSSASKATNQLPSLPHLLTTDQDFIPSVSFHSLRPEPAHLVPRFIDQR